MELPANLTPSEAIDRLCERIEPVSASVTEQWTPSSVAGRILAEVVELDRDSPACDVSAMDGFAVRLTEFEAGPLPIEGECLIGAPPARLPPAKALRIYTGSPVPEGCDTVVPLERVDESDGVAVFARREGIVAGANIRRQGENARGGDEVLAAGSPIGPAAMTALATIEPRRLSLHRRLKVAIITTGDELERNRSHELPPWRLRDSNGPTLEALIGSQPWVETTVRIAARDTLRELTGAIREALKDSDAVVLTGGVSKGAYDFVPEAVTAAGGEPLFHRLAARPGRPTFAAIADGRPVVGLPGNPLAVLTAGTRLLGPALRKRAGVVRPTGAVLVRLEEWAGKTLPIWWWRPVVVGQGGDARVVPLRGSGDTCGPAISDGFIECPPGAGEAGHYPFFPWSL